MAVPAAPTALAVTPKMGLFEASWTPPAGPVDGYYVDYSTTNTFTVTATRTSVTSPKTVAMTDSDILTPGGSYYARVKAYNSDGTGAASSTFGPFVMPSRDALDAVRGASVQVDGHQVEIRSNGTDANPMLTLGVVPMGLAAGDTTFTTIEVLPRGGGGFESGFGDRGFAIAVDPIDGDLYVIGTAVPNGRDLLVRKYNRTGATTWAAVGTLTCTLPVDDRVISQVAASFAPGVKPSIVVVYRRTGGITASGSFGFAVLNPQSFVTADPFVYSTGNDPSWMSTPGAGGSNTHGVDIERMQRNGNTSTFAVASVGYATIEVTNAVITGVAKAASGTALGGLFKRVLALDSSSFALVYDAAGGVNVLKYDRNCTPISGALIASASFQGGTTLDDWAAWFDTRLRAVNVDYITSTAGSRQLARYRFYVDTGVTDTTTLSSAFGAAGATSPVRVPVGLNDERRVIIEGANLNGSTKTTVLYADRTSNVAPAASLSDKVQFDATAAQIFTWGFADANTGDTQRAYEIEIQRTSDSVNVVDVAKTVSTSLSYTVAGGVLANNVTYRWRVMTYDQSDAASAWTAYDTFVTAAVGTLTITTPNADDLAGFNTSTVALNWTYTQPNGYVQTTWRVRVLRDSDGVVLSDTGNQVNAMTGTTVTGVPTDVRVRIELSVTNNAPVPVTVVALRYLTSSYSLPMAPLIDAEDEVGDGGYVVIRITNDAAIGDRPDTAYNIIQRRTVGGTEADWVSIGTAEAGDPNVDYHDYTVEAGGEYEYQVIAVGGGAQNPSVSTASGFFLGTMMGVWLHDVTDPGGTAHNWMYTNGGRKETLGRVSTSNTLVGRRHPVIDFGDAEDAEVQVTFEVPFSSTYDDDITWWRERAVSGGTLFYRDNRGRALYTAIAKGVAFSETRSGMLVAVTFPEIDYELDVS